MKKKQKIIIDTLQINLFLRKTIRNVPIVESLARHIYRTWINPSKPFLTSAEYWKKHYAKGGNSGAGSYDKLAFFKAEILNKFVRDSKIESIIEFGCGDGNQLRLADYPSFIGYDISPTVISRCKVMFSEDKTKKFKLTSEYSGEVAQLTLSLDVIFHLIEDKVFCEYMEKLFNSSNCFVIIYSSNFNDNFKKNYDHVKHRKFSDFIEKTKKEWKLLQCIPNKYPWNDNDPDNSSNSEFFIYKKI